MRGRLWPRLKNMTKKDIAEIRKSMKLDTCCLTMIGVCYVSQQDGPTGASMFRFLTLEEEVMGKYLELAKKGLSGKLGKNIVNLASDGSGEPLGGILAEVRETKNEEAILKFAEQIAASYVCDTDYCIMCLFGTYDVPASSSKKDQFLDSEEVYDFVQCLILPVKMSKPGLAYDLKEGGVCSRKLIHEINAPSHAFLYPVFTDRSTDVDHILYYAKKPAEDQSPLSRIVAMSFCEPRSCKRPLSS